MKIADYIRCIPDFPKPGVLFRDITPLLAAPQAFRQAIADLAKPFREKGVALIAAAEARGFIFAAALAMELGVGLVPIRKSGKLPGKCISHTYQLEYGTATLQIHADAIPAGARVLVADDLLATGGTIEACCQLVEKAGGTVLGCEFGIELTSFGGAKRIARYPVVSLLKYE